MTVNDGAVRSSTLAAADTTGEQAQRDLTMANPTQSGRQDGQQSGRRRTLFAQAIATLVDAGESQTLSILWPSMYRSLDASVGQLGPILGISELVNTLVLPLWGFAVDRFSRKTLLVWITGFWGLWTLAIGFVNTLPQLYVVRILSALGLGLFIPAAFSLIGDLYTDQERGRVSGLIAAVNVVGAIVAFAILSPMATLSTEAWRFGFMAMGIASAGTGLLLWFLLHEPVRGAAEPELAAVAAPQNSRRYLASWSDVWSLFQIRSWRWLLLREVLEAMSFGILAGWSFTWLEGLGLGESAIVVVMLMTLSMVAGAMFFGWLRDRIEQRFPNRGRLILAWAGLIASLPIVIGFVGVAGDNVVLLTIFGILFGLSMTAAGDGVMWPMIQGIIAPELRGSGRSIINMAKGLVAALMLTASGWLADQLGVATMLLYVTPGPLLISIFAWLPLFRTYAPDREALQRRLAQRRAALIY